MTYEVVANRALLLRLLTDLARDVRKDKNGKIIYDEITLELGVLVSSAYTESCEDSYAISYLPRGLWRDEDGNEFFMEMYHLGPPRRREFKPRHLCVNNFTILHRAKLSLQGMIDMLSADQSTHVRFQYEIPTIEKEVISDEKEVRTEMTIVIDGDTPRVVGLPKKSFFERMR